MPLPMLTFDAKRDLWSLPDRGCFTPGKETWYTLYRRWGWASGLVQLGLENIAFTTV